MTICDELYGTFEIKFVTVTTFMTFIDIYLCRLPKFAFSFIYLLSPPISQTKWPGLVNVSVPVSN